MSRNKKGFSGIVILLLLTIVGGIAFSAYAQQAKRRAARQQKEETYTRPRPTKPVKPVIPSQNRYQSSKVFLEYADRLYKLQTWNDSIERQIVSGNVKFRQGSLWMYCDSAYYYPGINSMDAFGHVKMVQGDTLFVYADKLFYNGNDRLAKLTRGPSENKVRLKDPTGELLTDTLDYDVDLETGFYGCGGELRDDINTLTSIFGQYNSRTKDAEFFYDVELINHKDNFELLSDTLYYNTGTHLARIDSPTDIYGPNDTIYASRGWYHTQIGDLEMTNRAIMIHKDSLGRATTIEGDSIVYDNANRISRAYQYRDITKLGQPTVLTDTASKIILVGGYGMYNDLTRESFATEYPLLKEYSRPDTLYLRADTIFTYIRTDTVWAPKFDPKRFVKAPFKLADVEYLEWPSDTNYLHPITKPEMMVLLDSVLKRLAAPTPLLQPVALPSTDSITSRVHTDSIASQEHPDSIALQAKAESQQNSPATPAPTAQTDSVEMIIDRIWDYHIAKAYPRARFFNPDIQGVADTLEFYENDSLMYMKRKPVVWSGERQVNGKEIILHFNDSTIDHAKLPQSGFMAEYVDEDFYNQLSGKKMEAWFEDDYLKRLYVEGNVQVIMLPMENDSTYNKLVDAESSYMTVELKARQIDKIKMWPEVTGNTTPIFLVKRAQKYLSNFKWLDAIRPKRITVDGVLKWEDELGEVPEQLEIYFEE